MFKTSLIFIYIFNLLTQIISDTHKNYETLCAAQQTCSQCLQTPTCVWCFEEHSNQSHGTFIRCATREKFKIKKDHWCSPNYVIDEKSSFEILEDKPLHSKRSENQVQIQPQKMRVRLRRGEEVTITLKYSQAEDYPVDLYYLMDLSFSMLPYRNMLSKLGDKLAEAMTKLTKNFRLGFGSFIDKVILPMTNPQKKILCRLPSGEPCAAPYGYKHQMALTESLTSFTTRVKEAPVSGNADEPEGGLDAIMQAVVCTEQIGWRQKARHLLVFSTDASFHAAGDGRLAGIVEPNDELCHLDNDGYYTHSLLQDYPSLSQINRKVIQNSINIIFAVPIHMNATYHLLSKTISGSSIGILDHESENVVSLVSDEYEKLADSVVMMDNAPKLIDVRYFSKCSSENSYLKERRKCDAIRVGEVVEFQVTLKAVDCPTNSTQWNQSIKVGPRDLTENLEIDVELICKCSNCGTSEKQGNTKLSAVCNNHGKFECGLCVCNSGFYGKQCECRGFIANNNLENCKASVDSDVCNGRGICKCGVCDCIKRANPQEMFYGTYCECDNFSCKRVDGLICGGKGTCECGSCICFSGWTGETCDCKESNSTCIPPDAPNMLCYERGDCVCGVCQCGHNMQHKQYSGQFCEQCSSCVEPECDELKDCVQCLAYKSGPLWKRDKCSTCIPSYEILKSDHLEDISNNKDDDIHTCQALDDGGCSFRFKYIFVSSLSTDKNSYFKVVANQDKDCPKAINVMGVALGVIISTVVLGFAILMIWKLIIVIYDRREYARFKRQEYLVQWKQEENPLYRQATITFKNPTFTEQKSRAEN